MCGGGVAGLRIIHQDNSPNNVSKFTAQFFEKKKRNKTGIEAIFIKCIPPKFHVKSSLDYCAFQPHIKTLDEVWNFFKEGCNKIDLDVLGNFLLSFESKCNMIFQQRSYKTQRSRK